jgi:hypothetical protein
LIVVGIGVGMSVEYTSTVIVGGFTLLQGEGGSQYNISSPSFKGRACSISFGKLAAPS